MDTYILKGVLSKKLVMLSGFSDNVELSSKNLWKIISADVRANVKQQNKGTGACILQIFIRSTLKTWNNETM